MGIKHPFVSSKSDAADATKVRPSAWNLDHTIDGDVNFSGHSVTNADEVFVADDPYNQVSWDGDLTVPTKNAIRDKIEALVLSGGGVTDFLALDDTPDTYVNASAGFGPYPQVNTAETALEFKYSTAGYIDIRDYGTVVDGGDITTALQAAVNDLGPQNLRVRVPCVGTGAYTCGTVTFPAGRPLILELDCMTIDLSGPWDFPGGYNVKGMRHVTQNFPHPYGSMPAVWIRENAGLGFPADGTACITVFQESMVRFENLRVSNGFGPAIKFVGVEIGTISNCQCGTNGLGKAGLELDSCFWIEVNHLSAQSRDNDPTSFSIDVNTATNLGLNCGIIMLRDIIVTRNGIRYKPTFGPAGTDNSTIHRIHMEGGQANSALITLDSTNNLLGQIQIFKPEMSDPVGGPSYTLKNIGTNTNGVEIICINGIAIDPASDPIQNLVIDNTNPSVSGPYFHENLSARSAGTFAWANYQQKTADWLDCTLACTPVGLPWTLGTPLPIEQDPANWISVAGGVITPGISAPDGSTMAGEVSGGSGALIFSPPGGTRVLAVGDYFLCGIWIRNPNPADYIKGSEVIIDVLGHPGVKFNGPLGAGSRFTDNYLHHNMTNSGWQWCCVALKVTSIGTNPTPFTIGVSRNGATRQYFNPCVIAFPAAANIDESWIINVARSLKGGWSSNSTAGNVGLLDHQILHLGAGGGAATGGLQANKIITPKAILKTIAGGIITVNGSYHRVDTEASAASDDLDTINGGVDGQRLVLLANNVARTIVCKDGTGNLALSSDFSLDNSVDTIELIYDVGTNQWLELTRSDNGA